MTEEELLNEYKMYGGDHGIVSYRQVDDHRIDVYKEGGYTIRWDSFLQGSRRIPPNANLRMFDDEDYFRFIFSINLRRLMDDREIDRYELAHRSGVGYSTITQYLNQGRTPNMYSVYKLAYVFECDISEFVRP